MIETRKTELCVQMIHSWKERIHGILQRHRHFNSPKRKEIRELKEELAAAEEKMNTLRREISEKETEKQNLIWRQELQLRSMETSNIEKVKEALLKAVKINFESTDMKARAEACCFPVFQDIETGKWHVYMNICSLGGCEYNDYEFDSEWGAYLFGTVLTQLGVEVDINSPCPDCYAEYMQNCI